MAADKDIETLKKELQESKQREADMQEHLTDLESKKELIAKSTISSKVLVKVDKKDYVILGNARVGGLGKSQIYTKEDLANPKNKAVLEELIKKGSGLIRPL